MSAWPVPEEFFTRGYLLGRARESFSAGGSLLVATVFFTVAHGQYRHTDTLAIGAQVSLLVWAAIAAYSVLRTASLVPAIIAHAIINVPMTVPARWAMLAVSLFALGLCRKPVDSAHHGTPSIARHSREPRACSVNVLVRKDSTVPWRHAARGQHVAWVAESWYTTWYTNAARRRQAIRPQPRSYRWRSTDR